MSPDQRRPVHVLLDVREQPAAGLEDLRFLEMVGFNVTDRRDIPDGLHAAAAVDANVIVLGFSDAPAVWTSVRQFRATRRTTHIPIVVHCVDATLAQHEAAHRSGVDVFLAGPYPGLEWLVRGVCAALAFRGNSAEEIPGFDRRARLGALLCDGYRPREPRVLVFDDKGLPLIWQLLRIGYAATPINITDVMSTLANCGRPDVVIVDVDAQSDAVAFICRHAAPDVRPPILCVAESPEAAAVNLGLADNDPTIQIVAKSLGPQRLAEHLARMVADWHDPNGPVGPDVIGKRLPIPHYQRPSNVIRVVSGGIAFR